MAEIRTNRTSVAFGIFFVVAGVAFLLERLDVLDLRARFLLPALLIAAGVAVLVGGKRPGP